MCVINQKKIVQKWPILWLWCAFLWNRFFSSWVFFVRLLVFEYIVDSVYGRFCISNTSKSRISQKLKVMHKKKTHELKIPFQSIAHLFWKFGHFWSNKNGEFSLEFQYKIDHISKNKKRINRITVFSIVSAHCASFL